MKTIWALVTLAMIGIAGAQDLGTARATAQGLVPSILRGDPMPMFEKLHPRYRANLAKAMGGDDKLRAAVVKGMKDAQANGVVIENYQVMPAAGPLRRVNLGKEVLALLPTRRIVRVTKDEETVRIEQEGFLAAIANVGTDRWSFIDGSTTSLADLRALFPELPMDLKLPEKKSKVLTDLPGRNP